MDMSVCVWSVLDSRVLAHTLDDHTMDYSLLNALPESK